MKSLTRSLLALLFLLSDGAAAQQRRPASTAFVDVTVVSMLTQALSLHQTVLIQGDRIVAIGPRSAISIPRDATRISGAGRFLMPGLIDMHVHFTRAPAAGVDENWTVPDYRQRNEDFGRYLPQTG